MKPSETEELLEISPALPVPDLQIVPQPSAWPVWLIGCLGLLATLLATGFAVLALALRHAGDGAPGPEPGIFGLIAIWTPALYCGLLTVSCLPGVDEARATHFLWTARLLLAVFIVIIVFSFGSKDPPARLSSIFLFALIGITVICEGSWHYLRRRKRWIEL